MEYGKPMVISGSHTINIITRMAMNILHTKTWLSSRMKNHVCLSGIVGGILLRVAGTLLFGIVSIAHAAGGDVLSPFPVSDARTGLQRATATVVDGSGNQIIAGYQNLTGGSDDEYLTVKVKADGLVAWRAIHNHSGGSDRIVAVLVDGNNDVIVTGYVWNGSNNDIHTIKYRGTDGSLVWENTWNGAAGGGDIATSLAFDSVNNRIYVAGYSQNSSGNDDFVVIKYTNSTSGPANPSDGAYTYNGIAAGPDRIKAIAANDAGFVVTGESYNGTDFDALTINYTTAGVKLHEWRQTSVAGQDDVGKAVALDTDGNIVVAATVSNGVNTDSILLKYDWSTGGVTWQKKYDGGFNDEPVALAMDGANIYLVGMTWTLAGHEDISLGRYLGATGELAWPSVQIYNSGGDDSDFPVGLTVGTGPNGGVFVTGYAVTAVSNDIVTTKTAKNNGMLLWQQRYNGAADRDERPVGIGRTPTGNVCVAGWTDAWTGSVTDYDVVSLRYDFGPIDPPYSLTATATTDNEIQINWINNGSNADGFKIERKLGDSSQYVEIATVASDKTTFKDPGLLANNYYYYRVRAYNAANGDSAFSNEAHALTKVVSYVLPIWTYLYDGAAKSEDYALSIAAGNDDHPVVTGYSTLEEEGVSGIFSTDYYTIKLDRTTKAVKWNARYDSSSGGMDRATVVSVLPDNDVLVTGNAYLSGAGGFDTDEIYTIKYQASTHTEPLQPPAELWYDQFGYAGSDRASAVAVATDASKKSVITGFGTNASGNDDIYVIKYNVDGTQTWPSAAIYDSGRNEYPTAVSFDAAGNVFVTGYTESSTGDTNWFTAKYDGVTGSLVWSDTFDGGVLGNDYARSLAVDTTGNAYVTGSVTTATGLDFYTIKYDGAATSTKRRIWEKRYDGPVHGDDKGMSVKVDPIDGAVMVSGTQTTAAGDRDFHLIRYQAADGVVLWERTFVRPGTDEYLTAMTLDSSGYIYVAGNSRGGPDYDVSFDSSSNILSLIYDFEGTFLGAMLNNGSGRQNETAAIAANNRGEVFVAGFWKNAAGNADYVVLKQAHAYILVPTPLTVTPQADYTKLQLGWQENSSGASFRIWRTLGPATPTSDWGTPVYDGPAGISSFEDSGRGQGINYCYRIEAYNGSLNSRPVITCATTSLPAATLSPLQVVSTNKINLFWNNIPANSGYRIERKIEAGSWNLLIETAANTTSFSDSGLAAGTLYSYRVTVLNAGGGSALSNVVSATTIPDVPVQSAATAVTDTQVTLNWSNVTGETGYKIERKQGAGGSWLQLASIPGPDELATTDTALLPNTQYYYRIRATNAAGDSVYSDEQGVLTLFVSTALAVPVSSSVSTIDLGWSNVAGETGYTVQVASCNYNGSSNDISYCIAGNDWAWGGWGNLVTVGADVTIYQHSGLAAGTAYRYRVIANVAGNSSAPSNVLVGWTSLAPPASIDVAPASETALTVTWNDVAGETSYAVERKQVSVGVWAVVSGAGSLAANTTSYADSGLGLQTAYCYRVKADSSLTTSSATGAQKCLSTPLPAPVLNLPVSPSTNQINLAWSNISGNTGYELQWRSLGSPDNPNGADWGGWTTTVPLAGDTTTYPVTGLIPGYTYQFQVRDTYSGGVSAWSNLQQLTTIPAAPMISGVQIDSTSQLTVQWNNVYGETRYGLEWKAGSGGSWSAPVSIDINVTSYIHSGLTPDTTYYYRIRATSSGGTSAYSEEVSQTTSLPELNPLTGITVSRIELSWNSIPGNSGYTIERNIENGGWATLVTTAANAVAYSDTGLTGGTLYSYRLKMLTAAGATASTNERSATTTPNSTAVTVKVLNAAQTQYSWPVTLGATNYKISRKLGSGGSYVEIANIAASYTTSYCGRSVPRIDCASPTPVTVSGFDGGLTGNTQYCYTITAWSSTGGDSASSSEECVTTSAMANENLAAQALNSFKVKLSWTELSCAPVACASPQGYELERKVAYGTWASIATVPVSQNEFIDKFGLDPLKIYTYRVRSYSATDHSPYSETSITMPAYQPDDTACQ